jgi:phenylalanyl-tRNA synthetase beta chain
MGCDQSIDFFDVKGIAEIILSRLGVAVNFRVAEDEGLHPGRTAEIVVASGENLGILGEIHPQVAMTLDLQEVSYLLEIDMARLQQYATAHRYRPLNRYPGVVRDIAVVVSADLPAQEVRDIIVSFALVSEVQLFDLYDGKQVPKGKKSLAYRITYQSPDHTLTDGEVDQVQQQIINRLSSELRATLRE